jgi:probable rRNA maturation factor
VTADRSRSIREGPWRIDLVRRAGVEAPLAAAAIARAAARALVAGGAPTPGSVTIVLTDDSELGELNQEHMGIHGPTDVLSFPMLPPAAFGRGAGRAPIDGPRTDRPPVPAQRGRRHVGDIAISVERATEQAEQGRGGQTGDVRWSTADEIRLLVTHGVLHLCGWDHAEPAEEAEMRSLERALLEAGLR